ncbi:uncharacterized protein SCHCODRAFT_02618737 [Schizophyllum commune H4-8]|nr:uncharacterized protein SCHCODRAFT_02618737 [Schizophyllum commune H4-8]KAI5895160.1 hypothetical protein SCHCODRAFT_02618737 [Schizophyllum commune H4-8]
MSDECDTRERVASFLASHVTDCQDRLTTSFTPDNPTNTASIYDQRLVRLRKPIRVVEDYLRQLRAGSADTGADMNVSSSDAVAALNAFEEITGVGPAVKEKIMNDTAKAEDVVVSLFVMEAIYKVVMRRV